MTKPSILLGLCASVLGVVAAAACSSPDPGVSYLGIPPSSTGIGTGSGSGGAPAGGSGSSSGGGSGGGNGSGSGSGSSSGSSSSGSGSSSGGGGGTPTDTDAGTTAPEDAGSGFLGETTPFAANPPPQTAAAQHAAAGQPAQTPSLDCGTCHTATGVGGAFLAAGFVSSAAGSTTPAAGVEVRVSVGGTGLSAYTDTNGFFWILPPVTAPTGPMSAGIRGPGGTPTLMPNTQTTPVDCQSTSCHGGTAGNIHYP